MTDIGAKRMEDREVNKKLTELTREGRQRMKDAESEQQELSVTRRVASAGEDADEALAAMPRWESQADYSDDLDF